MTSALSLTDDPNVAAQIEFIEEDRDLLLRLLGIPFDEWQFTRARLASVDPLTFLRQRVVYLETIGTRAQIAEHIEESAAAYRKGHR